MNKKETTNLYFYSNIIDIIEKNAWKLLNVHEIFKPYSIVGNIIEII